LARTIWPNERLDRIVEVLTLPASTRVATSVELRP